MFFPLQFLSGKILAKKLILSYYFQNNIKNFRGIKNL